MARVKGPKSCPHCHAVKPAEQFPPHSRYCADCVGKATSRVCESCGVEKPLREGYDDHRNKVCSACLAAGNVSVNRKKRTKYNENHKRNKANREAEALAANTTGSSDPGSAEGDAPANDTLRPPSPKGRETPAGTIVIRCTSCSRDLGVDQFPDATPICEECRSTFAQMSPPIVSTKYPNKMELELATRVLSKRRLIHFVKRFRKTYKAGWVHQDICARLERFIAAVERGEGPRLILSMPPRHGKSTLVSQYFPGFILGHHPEWEVVVASYALSLPINFSRMVRSLLTDPKYETLFPDTKLSTESQAAEMWSTTRGGSMSAVGIGSGLTGRGAHCLIIDDYCKDASEADSEVIRDNTYDWYTSTAYTRLAPGGGVLITATRWHDDDLIGRVLALQKELTDQGASPAEIDRWELVEYPAIADHDEYLTLEGDISPDPLPGSRLLRAQGEALHPARFDLSQLLRIRSTLQKRHWTALYQQKPVPDEGDFFTKDMFRYYPVMPDPREWYTFITVDPAVGEKRTNDWTVFAVGAVDPNSTLHILNIVRVRKNTHEIVEIFLDLVERYHPMAAGIEQGVIYLSLKPQLDKRMRERNITVTIDARLKPVDDKRLRAGPLQGRMQQGMVMLPPGQPWVEALESEFLRFPNGKHDDIVDAMAWLVRLSMMHGTPKPPKRATTKSWKNKVNSLVERAKSAMAA